MKNNPVKKLARAFTLLAFASFLISSCQMGDVQRVEQWGVYELSLTGPSEGNPYMDNSLDAEFTNGSQTVMILGFYDGSGSYKIRFSPDQLGRWTYVTPKQPLPHLPWAFPRKCILSWL